MHSIARQIAKCLNSSLAAKPRGAIGPAHEAPHHRHLEERRARPQGKAIQHALGGLGFEGVEDVRAGKIFELELADSTSDEAVDEMCRKLLANTVIENYRVEKL